MAKRKINADLAAAATARVKQALTAGQKPASSDLATAARFILEELAHRYPGKTLEVRVPPYGAVQCLDGPKHTRGTPPNVVELTAETLISLATGQLKWEVAVSNNLVASSGVRASLAQMVPL